MHDEQQHRHRRGPSAVSSAAKPSGATSRQRQQLCERAEEILASHDARHAARVNDRDDQHAVMQEDLRYLGVGEVLADVDVLGVHVLADRLGRAVGTRSAVTMRELKRLDTRLAACDLPAAADFRE